MCERSLPFHVGLEGCFDHWKVTFLTKREPELKKLPGVGKFFNRWQPDPPTPQKRKYQTENRSLTENIRNFYECKKRQFF